MRFVKFLEGKKPLGNVVSDFWRKEMDSVTKVNVLLEKNRFFIRRRYFVCVSHDLFRLFAQRIDFNILSSHFEFQEKFIDFSVLIYLD